MNSSSLSNNNSSHGDDSDYTAAFVNSLSNYVVGSRGEIIQVFYDMFSLKEGEQFDGETELFKTHR